MTSKKASILGFDFVRAIESAIPATNDRGQAQAAKLLHLEMKEPDVIQVTACDGVNYCVAKMRCEGQIEECSVAARDLDSIINEIKDSGSIVELNFDSGSLKITAEGNNYRLRYSTAPEIYRPGEYETKIADFNSEAFRDAITRSISCCIKDDLVAQPWMNSVEFKANAETSTLNVYGCDTRRASVCRIPAKDFGDKKLVAIVPIACAAKLQRFLETDGEAEVSLFVRGGTFEVRTPDGRFGGSMKAAEYPPVDSLFSKTEEAEFDLHEIAQFQSAVRTAANMSDEEIPSVTLKVSADSDFGIVVGSGERGDFELVFPIQNAKESFEIKARANYLIQAVQYVRHDRSNPLHVGFRKERRGLHFKGDNHDYLVMGIGEVK